MASKTIVKGAGAVLAGLVLLAGTLLLAGRAGPQPAEAAACWTAAITEQWADYSLAGSVLRVSVQGQAGLQVKVRAKEGGFETTNRTGTKPEYGPYVAEFAPLNRGTYVIEPEGIGLSFELWLDGRNYTRVDFTPKSCAPPATATATAVSTRKATATPTHIPAASSTPKPAAPTAQPAASGWRVRVAQRLNNPSAYLATIAVRVIGQPAGQVVEIRSGAFSATCKTGTKPEHGPDACEFGALNAGTYTLTPAGLGIGHAVTVALGDFVLVEFYSVGGPTALRWVGTVKQNTSGPTPTEASASAIAVVVSGRPWLEVEIRAGGWTATCTTGYKPEYGPAACEFGGLRPGTYTLAPKGLDVSAQVTVDGWGWALVQFDPIYAPAPPAPPAPSATVRPTARPAGPTATPTATAPGPRWQGWVESNTSGTEPKGISSVVVVRVLGRGGVPVTITGGGSWSATCVTGTKPEYGPDACEFGGLWAATYALRPEGADVEVTVTMDGVGIAFVNFQAR